ncbi:MAG: LPS export ABC transporter periplasmic protein LptC [Cyanobacteria bacterium J06554_11]
MNRRWYRGIVLVAVLVAVAFAMRVWLSSSRVVDSEPEEEVAAELTLQTVTLEQPDEEGVLLWRLKAETVNYLPDTERAELLNLEGEFFQAGEVIYTVTADEGEVQQNGEILFLRGNLLATGIEDELTLEGERLKWVPKEDLLVMGDFEEASGEVADEASERLSAVEARPFETPSDSGETPDAAVRGANPQLDAIAQVVTVKNKENRVDFTGGVVAKSKETPWLTFESDALSWFTKREEIEANQPVVVENFETNTFEQVTERLSGQSGFVDLAENMVTLENAVRFDVLDQPLILQGEQAVWDVDSQLVTMDQPVNIAQPARRVTATSNRASLDLAQEVIYLTGDVRAVGEENDSRLAADEVTWKTTTQDVEATGDVRYQQAADPEISMAGTRAVGNIETGTLVVTGGESGDVFTEIVPDDF